MDEMNGSRDVGLSDALSDLRRALSDVFSDQDVAIEFSWEIGSKVVSEIGGRLLEDLVADKIEEKLVALKPRWADRVKVDVPLSGKTIEDVRVELRRDDTSVVLLVDVKGHNELRSGARPNLASIRKCIELYGDPSRVNHEIVIFFCRYRPSIEGQERSRKLSYRVDPASFSECGTFPLRFLSEENLSPQNIGSGGQLLLARESQIEIHPRQREEFLALLRKFNQRIPSLSPKPIAPLPGEIVVEESD